MQELPRPEERLPRLPLSEESVRALDDVPRGFFASLCFDRGDHALLRIVNDVLSRQGSSSLKRLLAPYLHPHGFGLGETGGRVALPVWLAYRKVVEESYPVEDFARPSGIVMGSVDGVPMAFKEGTERGSPAIADDDQEKVMFSDPNAPLGKGEDLLKQMF